jgi:hypothetical protein
LPLSRPLEARGAHLTDGPEPLHATRPVVSECAAGPPARLSSSLRCPSARRPVVSECTAGPPARLSSSLRCPSARRPVVSECPAGAAVRFARVPWTEAFACFGRILSCMAARVVRLLASALVAFLLAQLIPALAFASSDGADCASSCGKDKMACCRRSHHSSGPAFSSRECSSQCQISVRQSQPVAGTVAPTTAFAELAPAISSPLARLGWIPSAQHDAVLFERPPPSTV